MSTSGSTQSDIRAVVESMREGFRRMDDRFEAIDKRFEDLIGQTNSRFTMMFFFMSAGFTILTVLMTLYRFIG